MYMKEEILITGWTPEALVKLNIQSLFLVSFPFRSIRKEGVLLKKGN